MSSSIDADRVVREHLATGFSDQILELVTHAGHSRQIDTALERDDVSGGQYFAALGNDKRCFRMAEPHTMARVVRKILCQTPFGELVADGGVNGLARDARAQQLFSGLHGGNASF